MGCALNPQADPLGYVVPEDWHREGALAWKAAS